MKAMLVFLKFDGNCGEAAEFYRNCLGAELYLLPFTEPQEQAKVRIMRATIMKGSTILLMAADTMPDTPFVRSESVSVAIHSESLAETKRLFAAFSEKGIVTMPLRSVDAGAQAGALTDQFGIRWVFQFVH